MEVLLEDKAIEEKLVVVESPPEPAPQKTPPEPALKETPPEPAPKKTPRSKYRVRHPAFDSVGEPTPMPAPAQTPASAPPIERIPAPPQKRTPALPPERQADVIGRALFPSMMAMALQMDRYVNATGYRQCLDRVLEQAGNPTDPVEIMTLEQLVLAHLRVGQLQANAGQAESLEAQKVYNAAAARLLSEFRRTALALKIYREPGTQQPEQPTSSTS